MSIKKLQKFICQTPEVLPETALARIAMPCQSEKVEPPICCQNQFHCQNEETFKIFSYFSGVIERRGDNRTYLVKWLDFIHNSLILTFNVAKNPRLGQIFQALILLRIKGIYIL